MKGFIFTVFMVFASGSYATGLDLTIPSDVLGHTLTSNQNTDFSTPILLANTDGVSERARKRRMEKNASDSEPRVEYNNSSWPAILGCGLLGLSLIGDSSAWQAGSAAACGLGLAYKFN